MPSDKQQFSPGSKNWILKYFQLVENNVFSIESISENHQKESTFNNLASKTGLIYGVPTSFIYFSNVSCENYTNEEKLKLLLFEALLYSYLQGLKEPFDKKLFIQSLKSFYSENEESKWFDKVFKTSEVEQLEVTLSSRILIDTPIFESNYWLNYLSNCFVFLDVILFQEFLQKKIVSLNSKYSTYVTYVMKGIIYMAYADNKIESKEQRLLANFLSFTQLEKNSKLQIETFINNGISKSDFNLTKIDNPLLLGIIFELGLLIAHKSLATFTSERKSLYDFGDFLGLSAQEINESEIRSNLFLIEKQEESSPFYFESRSSLAFQGFSNRWIRILGRNKDKLISELKESKELVALIQKSTTKELTKEEKEMVKNQFIDILKSVPSIGIFLLPGGALLLPLILKIVPDLLPSSFKENQVDQEKN
ncbi:MAG: hypothetical protein EBR24_06730 [Flavobacteriia bacterium]|nr:hypothetical protein [Flavobacteriia bacterium]